MNNAKSLKVGDRVLVDPENPNHWTDSLYGWISGRVGTIEEVKGSPDDRLYLVKFNASYYRDMQGRDDVSNSNKRSEGGDAWHCMENDISKVAPLPESGRARK